MDESNGWPMAARGAAWRRRQRRLRSMLRHERQTVAVALAESQHHSAKRPKMARAGEWGGEASSATRRRSGGDPPLPSWSSSACRSTKIPAVPGHPVWVSRGGDRRGFCVTSWSMWLTSVCPFVQVRGAAVPQMGNQLLEGFQAHGTLRSLS